MFILDFKMMSTEHLQTWNRPRKLDADPQPTDTGQLVRKQYGIEKTQSEWMGLSSYQQKVGWCKCSKELEGMLVQNWANQSCSSQSCYCISVAQTFSERRKANQAKLLLEKYGYSCFLQLLDEAPAPLETHLDEIKQERLSRAAAQKKLLHDLAAKQSHVNDDHTYASISNGGTDETVFEGQKSNYSLATSQLMCKVK